MTTKNKRATSEDDAGVDWLDVDLNTSTDEEVEAILDEFERTSPKPKPARRPAHPPSGMLVCPMPSTWRHWDLLGLTYRKDCPPGSDKRITSARSVRLGSLIRTPRLRWEMAEDDGSLVPLTVEDGVEPWRWAAGTPSHIHTEFVVDGQTIHIDVVAATKFGPGRSYWEARIFVDSQLAGRGGGGGCSLGGGGSDLPARALLDRGTVITVSDGGTGWPRGFDAASLRPVVALRRVVQTRSRKSRRSS